MKKEPAVNTGISDPAEVNDFIVGLKHPLKEVVRELRKVILSVDENIGEGIFYHAPVFFFTGEMKPSKPREYRRYVVGFNLFKEDCVRLIFLRGARVKDSTGFLQGDYKDGRRLALFFSNEDVRTNEKKLKSIVKELVKKIHD